MKRILTTLAVAATLVSCSGRNEIAVTLQDAVDNGRYLYGHQDDLMYGHFWNATKDNDHNLERSDVKSVCGRYPAMLGLDLGGLETGSQYNLDGNDFDIMREAATAHYRRGGVVTLSWHLRNPLTGGDAWDVSNPETVASILPGGEAHDKFTGWLDIIGDYIASLGIPVIFRPWHEHTGSWFWWGAGLCTAEEYNALWAMTYDRLVNVKGLGNMLWAISPNAMGSGFESWEQRYPGDSMVDIVGLDCYAGVYGDETIEQANKRYISEMRVCLGELNRFSSDHGKILAVTETGFEGLPYDPWWTGVLQPALEGFPVAYVLTWRNTDEIPRREVHFYAPWPGSSGEEDFRAFSDSPETVFLD